jgi:two-component system nitrogen regulation response regulator GlnG/two-component system response regulator HydG
VLLLGESGTGKELVAQAIHASSSRRAKRLVARNAATFPSGLIDAELFGNVANYPNAGMPERPGVVGEADGGTLFLDEIGELPTELQSHLLRVLDAGGDYQRLGDAKRRRADVRVVAATNRPLDELKHDLAARLSLRIELPGLDARREDVPLLARHLLRRHARKDPPIGARFFSGWDGTTGEPRIAPGLVRALVTHRYTTHVRELEGLLLTSLVESRGSTFELTESVRDAIVPASLPAARARAFTAEEIRTALEKHHGVRERVWRDLGMPNRYVLQRLMKKFGLGDENDE